jgi:hypothetical protein
MTERQEHGHDLRRMGTTQKGAGRRRVDPTAFDATADHDRTCPVPCTTYL